MIFIQTPLTGSYEIALTPFIDNRGWFSRTYCESEFSKIGHNSQWKQLNHSFTEKTGTIRGMHYQLRPYQEIKLVRCIAGSVYDVIIDIRENSPTFLKWFSVTLSAEKKNMIYIPAGFAHGFQTLQSNSELIYHHSEFYTANAESGINYDDKLIKISWPLPIKDISERDRNYPPLTPYFKGI